MKRKSHFGKGLCRGLCRCVTIKGDLGVIVTEPNYQILNEILVLTVRKSFWASSECKVFPNRVYTTQFYGYSQNRVNSLFVALKGLMYVARYRPRLILFGSAPRIVPWFTRLKQAGWLRNVKLLATNQIYFNDTQAQYLDRIIVYSRCEIDRHDPMVRHKYVYMPLPADGAFDAFSDVQPENYIFSGGGHYRDFKTLIEAVSSLGIPLKIVTFSPKTLNYSGPLPDNCEVHWTMPLQKFLKMAAHAQFVVVPLQEGTGARGHTLIVQALSLGKAIITTCNAGIDDYVTDGQEGFVVPAGDIEVYRQSILKLWQAPARRRSCEQRARIKAQDLTYEVFARRLVALCHQVLA
jgi:glycosyltransferase involved in cell wall biosynthesis